MICYVTEGKNTFKKNWITKNSRGKKGHEKVIKIYEEFIVSTTNTGLLECLAENDDGVLSSEMNKIVKFYHNFKKKCFRLDLIYKNLQNENYTILIFTESRTFPELGLKFAASCLIVGTVAIFKFVISAISLARAV